MPEGLACDLPSGTLATVGGLFQLDGWPANWIEDRGNGDETVLQVSEPDSRDRLLPDGEMVRVKTEPSLFPIQVLMGFPEVVGNVAGAPRASDEVPNGFEPEKQRTRLPVSDSEPPEQQPDGASEESVAASSLIVCAVEQDVEQAMSGGVRDGHRMRALVGTPELFQPGDEAARQSGPAGLSTPNSRGDWRKARVDLAPSPAASAEPLRSGEEAFSIRIGLASSLATNRETGGIAQAPMTPGPAEPHTESSFSGFHAGGEGASPTSNQAANVNAGDHVDEGRAASLGADPPKLPFVRRAVQLTEASGVPSGRSDGQLASNAPQFDFAGQRNSSQKQDEPGADDVATRSGQGENGQVRKDLKGWDGLPEPSEGQPGWKGHSESTPNASANPASTGPTLRDERHLAQLPSASWERRVWDSHNLDGPPKRAPLPIREIDLKLPSTDGVVDVQLRERAGRLAISVKTEDADLARRMRSDLRDLFRALESKGYEATGRILAGRQTVELEGSPDSLPDAVREEGRPGGSSREQTSQHRGKRNRNRPGSGGRVWLEQDNSQGGNK